ncbi:FAD binding domain-containing protein [Aspergillus avenaceus]|uniref:Sm protein F n=1 Tax=Aspergillus avenaceus TaxID=36643 RepID=A0A5N6TKB4_ASPAV|nr:FAD binding domain-containing protein [Aspergillus avenaceus]
MAHKENQYDIVIVGAGPVGILLSLCMSRWGYKVKHIDNRPVPTATGRADGIQPRSTEILRNLGLKRQIMAYKPAKVYDVAFWDPLADGKGIHRTGSWPSCPRFIDTRYPFTTLVHQGKIERVFLDEIEKAGTTVERPWTIIGFKNDGLDETYPVEVQLKCIDTNVIETVRSKYLFSGEGARSFVRQQLDIQIHHKDPISYVWGVMDGVVRTNFPDIETKCTIHSDAGSIMVIPREDNMVRLYVQIASSTDPDFNPRKTATVEEVQEAAKKILMPYWVEWDRVEWYSVYPIGQGISERYTLDERVFMGGDACHTHSPKAGQGMNTAFHDALNMAWKLHAVESGLADRSILKTYESERKDIAETLLNFDARYASLFSKRRPTAGEVGSASHTAAASGEKQEDEFVKTFKSSCEFTSGYGVAYKPNVFNWDPSHPAQSPLFDIPGVKLTSGRAFTPSTVTRLADANFVHLEQEVPANGAFRIFVFAGKQNQTKKAIADLAANLEKERSFLSVHRRPDIADVSFFERHQPHSKLFTLCLVYAAQKNEVDVETVPQILRDYHHHIYADDIPDVRAPGAKFAAHEKLGFDPEKGGVVVTRPDSHVACTVQLVEGSGTVDALNAYFNAFSSKPLGQDGQQSRLYNDLIIQNSPYSRVTELRPTDTPEEPYYYTFKVQCTSCRETHPNWVSFNRFEQHEIPGSRGEANFVWKCKLCGKTHSASIVAGPNTYEADEKRKGKKVIDIDCRGLEFTEFKADGEWEAKGTESSTPFGGIDLSDSEWYDYDEKAGDEVSIKEISFELVIRLKWGQTEYKGRLESIDSYMNVLLRDTEEYIDGKPTGTLGLVLIRCNNILWMGSADSVEMTDLGLR